jgi:hypothetical protein
MEFMEIKFKYFKTYGKIENHGIIIENHGIKFYIIGNLWKI